MDLIFPSTDAELSLRLLWTWKITHPRVPYKNKLNQWLFESYQEITHLTKQNRLPPLFRPNHLIYTLPSNLKPTPTHIPPTSQQANLTSPPNPRSP